MQMRRSAVILIAAVACLGAVPNAHAQKVPLPELSELKEGGPVSLGLAGGTTTGVSLKVWPARAHGIVLHLGGAPPVLNSMSVHLSYRLHFPPIVAPDGGPVLHFQIGPAFRTRLVFSAATFAELGGGVVVGASVTVPSWPVEFFAEVQPTFAGSVSAPGTGLGLGMEGVGGVRVAFRKKNRTVATLDDEGKSWGRHETVTLEPEPSPEEGDEGTEGKEAASEGGEGASEESEEAPE